MSKKKDDALTAVETALKSLLDKSKKQKKSFRYAIPSLWLSSHGTLKRESVNPFAYYLGAIRTLRKSGKPLRRTRVATGGEWSKEAVVYNMFVRATTAFDHDSDGVLGLPLNKDGFRETGTFLKALALLPYIKQLGANTIHLLPITSIGRDGNKGSLGSPYAIKNPYELDENLSEPCLGLDVKTEFRAFVEAAHMMGFRVVVEFVFRTAAKDADWVREFPQWFYWIRDEILPRDSGDADESKYGSPVFSREELEHIHHEVRNHKYDNLIAPHATYREMFTQPPQSVVLEDGRYVGRSENGQRMRIPGAFADWPPDDNQPPWGDVTYLRMYNHPEFNYIAYNTIRMYDTRLAQQIHVNKPLWEKIVSIIPYFQETFGIDGVMIDMGHALPMDLKREIVHAARRVDPDFAFWDENFAITYRSREEGYNAVFGFLWIDEHHPSRMKGFCHRCEREGFPIPYFATPENHNTPRAMMRPGGSLYSRWSWVINSFLPAIPFIHSGFELAEDYPINTGLDFSKDQLKDFPSEKLPLFSEYAYGWVNEGNITEFISRVSAIREKYKDIVIDHRPEAFAMLHSENEQILAFARMAYPGKKHVAIVTNTNYLAEETASLRCETSLEEVRDLLSRKKYRIASGALNVTLAPGQCLIFEF